MAALTLRLKHWADVLVVANRLGEGIGRCLCRYGNSGWNSNSEKSEKGKGAHVLGKGGSKDHRQDFGDLRRLHGRAFSVNYVFTGVMKP